MQQQQPGLDSASAVAGHDIKKIGHAAGDVQSPQDRGFALAMQQDAQHTADDLLCILL